MATAKGHNGQRAEIDRIGDTIEQMATPRALRAVYDRGLTVVPCWHVVHNVHESEARARDILKRCGFEIYYPQLSEMKRVPNWRLSKGQRKSPVPIMERVLMPLFPRYVFVRFSIASNWHDIFKALGLLGVLCDAGGHRPCPFPDEIIAAMRACQDQTTGAIPGRTTVQQLAFKIGESVRIKDGPLAGQPATVDCAVTVRLADLDESAKVKLLVALFGRAVVVELPVTDVEKL